MTSLTDDLASVLGDALILEQTERISRARDTWSRSQIAITGGRPEVAPVAVCAPDTTELLAEAVKVCRAHGAPMILEAVDLACAAVCWPRPNRWCSAPSA